MPNIDACRFLSMKHFEDFDIEYVGFEGVSIPLSSIENIIDMKQSTINYLENTLRNIPRHKDIIDLRTLTAMRANGTYDVDAII